MHINWELSAVKTIGINEIDKKDKPDGGQKSRCEIPVEHHYTKLKQKKQIQEK